MLDSIIKKKKKKFIRPSADGTAPTTDYLMSAKSVEPNVMMKILALCVQTKRQNVPLIIEASIVTRSVCCRRHST